MCSLSPKEEIEIIDALLGNNHHTEATLSDKYGISIEDIEELMGNKGYERCEQCDYWYEWSEVLDDVGEITYVCQSCRMLS